MLSHNLSYESLTSCEACQAILDLHTTNPQFYGELTSGHYPCPTASEVVDKDIILESEHIPKSKDDGHRVNEAVALILNAWTADEAAQPMVEEPKFEEDDLGPLVVGGDI
ncbi:hypothetical protein FRC11_011641 [Ceratobasidium sp. 423]|nr:hypothetical protein FRC11_011641 [Ceratobasidium sp. 423]